jgi:hypothetical protein
MRGKAGADSADALASWQPQFYACHPERQRRTYEFSSRRVLITAYRAIVVAVSRFSPMTLILICKISLNNFCSNSENVQSNHHVCERVFGAVSRLLSENLAHDREQIPARRRRYLGQTSRGYAPQSRITKVTFTLRWPRRTIASWFGSSGGGLPRAS